MDDYSLTTENNFNYFKVNLYKKIVIELSRIVRIYKYKKKSWNERIKLAKF